jgi:hypothetical protein
MFMIISDCYNIKWYVSHVWCGCWTIKALVGAEVLCDGFSLSFGGIAAPLIIARPLRYLIFITDPLLVLEGAGKRKSGHPQSYDVAAAK